MKRLLIIFSLLLAVAMTTIAERQVININPVWKFKTGDPADAFKVDHDDSKWDVVSLPHSHRIFDAYISDFRKNGREVGWYRRIVNIDKKQLDKKVFLVFQGAMQATKLWVNGKAVGEYAVSGYDSFHFDITPHVKKGKNLVAVRVDNTSRNDIPPDGTKRDYILFGGLYRDVDLVVTDPVYITFPWETKDAGIRLGLPEVSKARVIVQVETGLRNDTEKDVTCSLVTRILDKKGESVKEMTDAISIKAGEDIMVTQKSEPIEKPHLWSPDNPYLYTVESTVKNGGKVSDVLNTRLGIRWVRWDKEKGFFLNGEHLKLVGANRHQTWPFIGNAVPDSLHRRDAEQIKGRGMNWVRLSHYPHDPDFLDDLDELGLMALAEGPTWFHCLSGQWEDNLEKSFRSMVRRDRNHPSIIIWNACVNHQKKHPRLVKAAIEEDPIRARGQDNIPAPMNFKHKVISGNAALCIEHTGHTFRTSRGENGLMREYECAKRHWEHTDAAYKTPGNSGLAVWCMYDYNTFHGASKMIARHGVLDLFRIPKLSYYWHLSELGSEPFTHGVPLGETKVVVFSNAEQVRLLENKDGKYVEREARKPDEGYKLNHPPYHFNVSQGSSSYKAEGLVDGKVVSSHEFHRAGEPIRLELVSDGKTITADGADTVPVFVRFVDKNGVFDVYGKDAVEFSITGPGQLVGENPTYLRAGQFMILVRSGFKPGNITVTASLPELLDIEPASLDIKSVPIDSNAEVDMPKTDIDLSTQSTIVPIYKISGAARRRPQDSKMSWFRVPAVYEAKPGEMVESESLMIGGEKSPLKLSVKGCEYRVYTSKWTSKPAEVKVGDALFFRMKAPEKSAKRSTAEITLDGIKRRWVVWNIPNPSGIPANVKLIKAVYGSDTKSVDVTDIMRNMDIRTLGVTTDYDSNFSDPHRKVRKKLVVEYEIDGVKKSKAFTQGNPVVLD
ncbi:MAG: beta galactosidase jelly roll domain-containing protein [Kiritimatiellae bacterium]|nr:beta galactosidase jelly roll domain-containing protein [Kiritimatiellia bacterium]